MSSYRCNDRGFGLIEILVTLGVLAVGILGVAAFHSTVTQQSQENKARSEAFAIAQSRLEEMRNYTGSASSYAEFDALYADTDGFVNSTTINGVNANFVRTESIAANTGEQKTIEVAVSWFSPEDETLSINLATEIGFRLPRSVGDVARTGAPPLVNPPTGRARLGEGVLPDDAEVTSNGDGTALYEEGDDLMLVVDEQIVLTLAMACQSDEGDCLDFVRIQGTVYIDTSSQGGLTPGDVSVVASDAAFCARYYTEGGETVRVTHDTASALTTSGGDYEYFDYTCYIGGGWHGNIGILLAGGIDQRDKVCVGDPVSIEPWEAPRIATRRAYRGMLYRHDDSTNSGRAEISDGQGGTLIRYFSHGIADGIELPEPGAGQSGHDFVIGSMQSSATDGSECVSQGVMVRGDSNTEGTSGDLFEGMPGDFICLNDGYLDDYDSSVFGHTAACPYDPTNPPSTRHIIAGTIAVDAPKTDTNDHLIAEVNALTSDGPGNCLVTPFNHTGSQYVGNYECDVYDWGNGWSGFVRVTYDESGMSCNPNELNFSGVRTDNSGNNFNNCSPGSFVVIEGSVDSTNPNNRYLVNAALSDGGNCTVANDGLSYSCVTDVMTSSTWDGSISFSISGGALCGLDDGLLALSGIEAGYHTANLTIENNTNQCP